ncbi:hypothetical protein F4703DRAFT_1856554, partial [Phycomyces blakesleeanus]
MSYTNVPSNQQTMDYQYELKEKNADVEEFSQADYLSRVVNELLEEVLSEPSESPSSDDSLSCIISDAERSSLSACRKLDREANHPMKGFTEYGLRPVVVRSKINDMKLALRHVALRTTRYGTFLVHKPEPEFLAQYIIDLNSSRSIKDRDVKRVSFVNPRSRLCQKIEFDSCQKSKPNDTMHNLDNMDKSEDEDDNDNDNDNDSGSSSSESEHRPNLDDYEYDELEGKLCSFIKTIENEVEKENTFGSSSKALEEADVRSRVGYSFDTIQYIREYLVDRFTRHTSVFNSATRIKSFRIGVSLQKRKMEYFYKKPEKQLWKVFKTLSCSVSSYMEDYVQLVDQVDKMFLQISSQQPFDLKQYVNFRHHSQFMVLKLAKMMLSIGQLVKYVKAIAKLILTKRSFKSKITIAKSLHKTIAEIKAYEKYKVRQGKAMQSKVKNIY